MSAVQTANPWPEGWDPADRPRMRMDAVLAATAARLPEQEAVVDPRRRLTFAQLDALATDVAAELTRAGVAPGARVAISVPTTGLSAALLYGVARAGAVAVPLNPYWVATEIADALQRAEVSYLVVVAEDNASAELVLQAGRELEDGQRPTIGVVEASGAIRWDAHVAPAAPTAADPAEIALVLFTSGSTSRPKGALLRHDALVGAANYYRLLFELDERDRYLLLLPIYHVGGIVDGMLASHLGGATCVGVPRFDPETMLAALEDERVTMTTAFDSLFHKLRTAERYSPERHRQLKKACGGENRRSYEQLLAMGIERLLPSYGLTEVSSAVSLARPDRPDEAWRGTVGAPVPGLDVRIVDPDSDAECPVGQRGEIRVRGWAVSPGYIDGTDGRDAAGFFRTGDLGSLGPHGELRFEGRLKQMIKSGGENVSEHEVEQFLVVEVGGIRQAAVVGVPDEEWGEKVVAFVELLPGETRSGAELRAACRGRLAGFKVPKEVWVLAPDEWPLLATGKLDKLALRERTAQPERSGR